MKVGRLVAFGTLLLSVVCAAVAYGGSSTKVTICHFPPGNSANYHTITVSEKALPAHLAHGDLIGGCFENCETLCDDGDPCTIDECYPGTQECLVDPPPVDCDDGYFCTVDSCDSAAGGCQNVSKDCSDGNLCTLDICSEGDEGACLNPSLCAPGDSCDPQIGLCENPCENVICTPLDQCHLAGSCSSGFCDDPVAPDGTACDDGNENTVDDQCSGGLCEGASIWSLCPCWSQEELANWTSLASSGKFSEASCYSGDLGVFSQFDYIRYESPDTEEILYLSVGGTPSVSERCGAVAEYVDPSSGGSVSFERAEELFLQQGPACLQDLLSVAEELGFDCWD